MKKRSAVKKAVGFIMDDIQHINVGHDTTFGFMLEAERRGWSIYYMQQNNLFVQDGKVFATMQLLHVQNDTQNYFQVIKNVEQELAALDIIFMRKDPPVDMNYLYTTQLLDLVEKKGVTVVNKPQALRNFNEKLFINYFPQCCVPTLSSADKNQLQNFCQTYNDVILKPLHGLGGESIFRVKKNDMNKNVIIETLTQHGQRLMMAQKFIPEISDGDKRILLIDGKPIAYAYARFPQAGDARANLAAGGKGKAVPLTEKDQWICKQIAPTLKANGLRFVGIDVIGDYLTEINITSPTCMRELDAELNLNIAGKLFDVLQNN